MLALERTSNEIEHLFDAEGFEQCNGLGGFHQALHGKLAVLFLHEQQHKPYPSKLLPEDRHEVKALGPISV